MTRGKPLSDDLRGVIINMGMSLDLKNILRLTGLRRRTVERIFMDYRNKGTVLREHMYQELRGRKHSLTSRDTKVGGSLLSNST
jgi:5S rRNA maturation endonuclease (ribonuclease M5)